MPNHFLHRTRIDRRTVHKAVLAGAVLAIGGLRPPARAGAVTEYTPRLPAPTGPHPVGVTTLYLVDRTRRDPWDAAIPVREVLVSVLYPARSVRGHPVAPQLTPGAATVFGAIAPGFHPGLPATGVDWAATATHAHVDAPAQAGRRPVLLYSPGGGDLRGFGTSVAEELASHGYVVVAVDHPGDAVAVEFADQTEVRDRVRLTAFRADPRTDPPTFRTMIDTRIADLRFVVDQLETLASGRNPDPTTPRLPDRLGAALDPRRVGVYGHSAGGTAAAETLYEDRRIAAAVDLEGYLDHPPAVPGQVGTLYPIAERGSDRPLLLVATDGFPDREGMARSWSALLARSPRRVRRSQVGHAAHWVFTDYATIAADLQAAGLITAATRNALVGPGTPATQVPLVRRTVRQFFTRHLPVIPGPHR